MQASDISILAEELQEQLKLYQGLVDVNREQFAILDQGAGADTDAMVEFVGKKQSLMQALEASEAQVKPKKDDWRAKRESIAEADRQVVDMLLDRLSTTIGDLIKMEDEAQARLETLMNQNSASVESIRKKSQVNRAYAAYGAKKPGARYIDQRAEGQ